MMKRKIVFSSVKCTQKEKTKSLQKRLFCLFTFFLIGVAHISAQQQTVKGNITDSAGEPIIGASVVEKGTTNGTVTDLNGSFALSLSSRATLLISYIGYVSQEIAATPGGEVNVILKEDTKVLDDVVVVGFATQKKANLTGSVGIAGAKDIEARPVTSATQALQGLIPGLKISTSTGELDKNMSISIRGTGTVGNASSGSPLILIDGMEGDLNTVNPQDIETISVLKDAAASSIYGSRAPFGVILVTTKKGSVGKMSINYNNNFRVSNPVNLPKMMDSYTFANYFNAGSMNNGGGQIFNDELMQKMLDYQAGKLETNLPASSNGQWGKPDHDPFTSAYANTDWYNEAYKENVFSQEHNVSINGGSEKVTYYTSFNFLDQGGLLRHGDDGMQRYNITAKMNATLTNWMKFNTSIRYTNTDNWRPTAFNSTFYTMFGRQTWPNLPVYDPNGYYFDNNTSTPPLMLLALGGERKVKTARQYYQAGFVLEPIKNWITNIELNYSIMDAKTKETSLPAYNHDVNGNIIDTHGTTSLYQDDQDEKYLNLNIYSEYSLSFNEKHNFKVMGGFQAEELKQNFFSVKKYGLMFNNMPQFDLSTGTDGQGKTKETEVKGNFYEWATAGFFGRINYDFEGRYLAEFNLRYDGTSRFRRGSRWQLSPSFSLGWNIARESFWESINNTVNLLKLRFSYGELGNQNTNDWYPTYRLMNLGAYNGNWLDDGKRPNTSTAGDLVSNLLSWESIRTWNIGLDYGLLNNRLTGSFDYFTRYTKDMVGPARELPGTLGVKVPNTNNCDLKTKGWEVSIAWKDHLGNGLRYGINMSLSDQITYIDSYPTNETQSIDTYLSGYKDGLIWGYETIGIAKSDEEMQAHLASLPHGGQDALGSQWAAGDIMYKDLDGDGKISEGSRTLNDHGDLKILGDSYSHYFFGIDLNAEWKGVDIRAFFQGVLKHDYWQGSGFFWGTVGDKSLWHARGYKEHEDYFRAEASGLPGNEIPANLDAYYPRPIFSNGAKNQKTQSRYVQDASYIRLKNLQLGYSLPSRWTQKIGLSKCRLYISAENLWTGTSLSKLFDPETIAGGTGGNAYPLSRTWSFGLSVTL